MTSDWKVNLISEPFELKQNEYDCNSTFIIFLSKAGVDYDRDDFGDLILDYEEWGTIDPPGPNKGFGSKIDPDFLEELWDDECRSKLIRNPAVYYCPFINMTRCFNYWFSFWVNKDVVTSIYRSLKHNGCSFGVFQ